MCSATGDLTDKVHDDVGADISTLRFQKYLAEAELEKTRRTSRRSANRLITMQAQAETEI